MSVSATTNLGTNANALAGANAKNAVQNNLQNNQNTDVRVLERASQQTELISSSEYFPRLDPPGQEAERFLDDAVRQALLDIFEIAKNAFLNSNDDMLREAVAQQTETVSEDPSTTELVYFFSSGIGRALISAMMGDQAHSNAVDSVSEAEFFAKIKVALGKENLQKMEEAWHKAQEAERKRHQTNWLGIFMSVLEIVVTVITTAVAVAATGGAAAPFMIAAATIIVGFACMDIASQATGKEEISSSGVFESLYVKCGGSKEGAKIFGMVFTIVLQIVLGIVAGGGFAAAGKEGAEAAAKEGAKEAVKEGAEAAAKEGAKEVAQESAEAAGKKAATEAAEQGVGQGAKAAAPLSVSEVAEAGKKVSSLKEEAVKIAQSNLDDASKSAKLAENAKELKAAEEALAAAEHAQNIQRAQKVGVGVSVAEKFARGGIGMGRGVNDMQILKIDQARRELEMIVADNEADMDKIGKRAESAHYDAKQSMQIYTDIINAVVKMLRDWRVTEQNIANHN